MKPDHQNGESQLQDAERIAYLIAGFLRKTLTEKEHDELDEWVVASEENTRLFEELTDEANIEAGLEWHKGLDQQKALRKIKQELGLVKQPKPFLKTIWPYVIAASLLVAVVGIYFLTGRNEQSDNLPVTLQASNNAIQPGKSQAVLTLANGRTIILDSVKTGTITKEGSVEIKIGENGEIIYNGNDQQMRYNTVATPRGGQYKIVLGDGTSVWLNADSWMKFPAGFGKNDRKVELQGEAFFEVAENKEKPFRVTVLNEQFKPVMVEVLGTQFNVNSYGDESFIKTTLVEGSVKVIRDEKAIVLQPGEQAQINQDLKVVNADIRKEIGWKDGLFVFKDATIQTIGAQVARWYDLDIVYKGAINYHFNATIDRKEPLTQLLKILEGTKRVQFKLEGRKLLIEP
jgi:transmembrane sensor